MRMRLLIFTVFFLNFFSNINSNINDKILAKIGNEIITNYDLINEVNTILALSNKKADKNEFQNLQNIAFQSLKKTLLKE